MIDIFRSIRGIVYWINGLLTVLAGWCILAMAVFSTYGVITRYFIGKPESWSFPLSAYLLVFVVFFALAETLQKGIHVRIEFVLEMLPKKIALGVQFAADIIGFAFMLLFIWLLWKAFYQSYASGRIDESVLGWPLAWVQWVLPFGAAMFVLTHALMIISRMIGDTEKGDPTEG